MYQFTRTPVYLELMGNTRMAGWLTTVSDGPSSIGSADVIMYKFERPANDAIEALEMYVMPHGVYAITPLAEETMLKIADLINRFTFHQRAGDWDTGEWVTIPAALEVGPADDIPF